MTWKDELPSPVHREDLHPSSDLTTSTSRLSVFKKREIRREGQTWTLITLLPRRTQEPLVLSQVTRIFFLPSLLQHSNMNLPGLDLRGQIKMKVSEETKVKDSHWVRNLRRKGFVLIFPTVGQISLETESYERGEVCWDMSGISLDQTRSTELRWGVINVGVQYGDWDTCPFYLKSVNLLLYRKHVSNLPTVYDFGGRDELQE